MKSFRNCREKIDTSERLILNQRDGYAKSQKGNADYLSENLGAGVQKDRKNKNSKVNLYLIITPNLRLILNFIIFYTCYLKLYNL